MWDLSSSAASIAGISGARCAAVACAGGHGLVAVLRLGPLGSDARPVRLFVCGGFLASCALWGILNGYV